MTSIGITIHFNPMCREDFKEERIVKAIKEICNKENVFCGIGYDEQKPYTPTKEEVEELERSLIHKKVHKKVNN